MDKNNDIGFAEEEHVLEEQSTLDGHSDEVSNQNADEVVVDEEYLKELEEKLTTKEKEVKYTVVNKYCNI